MSKKKQGHPARVNRDQLHEEVERLTLKAMQLVPKVIRDKRFNPDHIITAKASATGLFELTKVLEGQPSPYEIHGWDPKTMSITRQAKHLTGADIGRTITTSTGETGTICQIFHGRHGVEVITTNRTVYFKGEDEVTVTGTPTPEGLDLHAPVTEQPGKDQPIPAPVPAIDAAQATQHLAQLHSGNTP